MAAYRTGSNLFVIGDFGSKVKVTVTYYPFFLHNYLLGISALLCPIIIKFNMSLINTLGRTNIQEHDVHLIIKVKMALTDDEGHR